MNTDTGRIYDVGDLYPSREDRRERDRRLAAERSDFERMSRDLDPERRAFETEHRAGKVVSVSEAVARQQRTGQRVNARRRKRKATKAARRTNRAH
jgi:hypothetical protein